jgi:DNA gyrase inhibitor GyrI
VSVPASLCLVCEVEGPPEAIGAAYAELYGRVLPASSERPALDFAIERYPGPGKTEICLPLRLA